MKSTLKATKIHIDQRLGKKSVINQNVKSTITNKGNFTYAWNSNLEMFDLEKEQVSKSQTKMIFRNFKHKFSFGRSERHRIEFFFFGDKTSSIESFGLGLSASWRHWQQRCSDVCSARKYTKFGLLENGTVRKTQQNVVRELVTAINVM